MGCAKRSVETKGTVAACNDYARLKGYGSQDGKADAKSRSRGKVMKAKHTLEAMRAAEKIVAAYNIPDHYLVAISPKRIAAIIDEETGQDKAELVEALRDIASTDTSAFGLLDFGVACAHHIAIAQSVLTKIEGKS